MCSKPTAAAIKPSGARIVVVDDEPAVARYVSRLLTRHGFRVWSESNCAVVLSRLHQEPDAFDLLVTDQSMPGMTGDELVAKARQLMPSLPVLLITGYSTAISVSEVAAWGSSAYIPKPIDSGELLEQINRLLAEVPQRS